MLSLLLKIKKYIFPEEIVYETYVYEKMRVDFT